jgi:hypothetical protein
LVRVAEEATKEAARTRRRRRWYLAMADMLVML